MNKWGFRAGRIQRGPAGRGLPTSSPPANPVGCWKEPVPAEEGLLSQLKRVLVGKPIPAHLAHHERLSRVTGLAVLSSDALSSVAYTTEFLTAELKAHSALV